MEGGTRLLLLVGVSGADSEGSQTLLGIAHGALAAKQRRGQWVGALSGGRHEGTGGEAVRGVGGMAGVSRPSEVGIKSDVGT